MTLRFSATRRCSLMPTAVRAVVKYMFISPAFFEGRRRLAAYFVCAIGSLLLCNSAQSQSVGSAVPSSAGVRTISLQEALSLARTYSPQLLGAQANAALAHEARVQARDARLPTVSALNQFIYTEGNGTPSGVFIANDGVHVYNEQAVVHEDLFSLVRGGQLKQARAAETVALAQQELARRGLVVTVVQRYYSLVTAERKITTDQESLQEAKDFVEVTQKQEIAGVVAHVDVVKAEIQAEQRLRDLDNSHLAAEQAHLALAVLLSSHFDDTFTVNSNLDSLPSLSSFDDVKAAGAEQNPSLLEAQASIQEAHVAATIARYAYLPSFSVNFYYGLDANQLQAQATNVFGATKSTQQNTVIPSRQNLGYAADVTLNVPVWDWGATRSKVRQAETNVHLAESRASFADRQVQANLRSFYMQTEVARNQVASLVRSRDLATENFHLTMLRYQAGEATALEAATAEDSLALARNAYEDGLNNFYIALAQLQTITGSL